MSSFHFFFHSFKTQKKVFVTTPRNSILSSDKSADFSISIKNWLYKLWPWVTLVFVTLIRITIHRLIWARLRNDFVDLLDRPIARSPIIVATIASNFFFAFRAFLCTWLMTSFSFSPRKVRVKNFGAKDFFPSRKSFALKTIRQGR